MNENKTARTRIRIMIVLFVLLSIGVIAKLIYIQVYNSSYYQQMAYKQLTRNKAIIPKRGKIMDRKGVVLAQSGEAMTVVANPGKIKKSMRQEVADKLSTILNLNYSDVLRRISSEADQVYIKRQISDEQATQIIDQRLVGVALSGETRRNYPLGNLASQLLGYTDLDGAGQLGLEKDFDAELQGSEGKVISEMNASGQVIPYGMEKKIPAVDGSDIALTTDVVIQVALNEALAECVEFTEAKKAIGIVYEIKTGSVLAMETSPGSDLNLIIRGEEQKESNKLSNAALNDSFQPGSSFSVFNTAAALDAGTLSQNATFNCKGHINIAGERIYLGPEHGEVSLQEAIVLGCFVAQSEIAMDVKLGAYYERLERFGFGKKSGIGLSQDSEGNILELKYVTSSQLASIGRGEQIGVTPIQFVSALGGILNSGKMMQAHIINKIVLPGAGGGVQDQTLISEIGQITSSENSRVIRELFYENVLTGEAKNLYFPGYKLGGDIGIAEKMSVAGQASTKKEYYVSSYAFAPADDPAYIVLIVIDAPAITTKSFTKYAAIPATRKVMQSTLMQMHAVSRLDEIEETIRHDIKVEDYVNTSVEGAKNALVAAGLTPLADGEGIVLKQSPAAGSVVHENSIIMLHTSVGNPLESTTESTIVLPNTYGMKMYSAYKEMSKWGLNVEAVGDSLGTVIMQSPEAGAEVAPNSTVYLTLRDLTEEPDEVIRD